MNALGIGLIPSTDDSRRLITASERLNEQFVIKKTLNLSDNRPHVSFIHMCELDPSAIVQIEQAFEQYKVTLTSTIAPELRPERFSFVPVGWCFLDIVSTSDLVTLHGSLFSQFRGFLAPPKAKKDISSYSREERESFLAYGYRYIGPAFRPHFTLGRLSNDKRPAPQQSALERICSGSRFDRNNNATMMAAKLSLFEIGPDGACQAIRSSYSFDVRGPR